MMKNNTIVVSVNEDEFREIMKIRHKHKKSQYIEINGARIYSRDKNLLKVIKEQLNSIIVTCELLNTRYYYDMRYDRTTKNIIKITIHPNSGSIRRMEITFVLTKRDQLKEITIDGISPFIQVLNKDKLNEERIIRIFNKIKEKID